MVDIVGDDGFDGAMYFGAVADVLAAWNVDFGADFFEGEVFVLLLSCFLEHGPEVFAHLGCDGDIAAFVVDGGVWFGGGEGDRIARHSGADGAAQLAGLDEMGCAAVAFGWPGFGEEAATGEVAVELVEEFHFDVAEDLLNELVHGITGLRDVGMTIFFTFF